MEKKTPGAIKELIYFSSLGLQVAFSIFIGLFSDCGLIQHLALLRFVCLSF